MFRIKTVLLLSAIALFAPMLCMAASQPDVRILDVNGNIVTIFIPYADPNALIQSVASADLGTDGISEILVGSGEDADPTVSVFRQDGSFIGSFLAYDKGYRGGVNVTACDVDGDRVSEIITGAAWYGGSHVRIFDAMGNLKNPGFFAFNESFIGGVNVACGDVTGDGVGDIVVGANAGGGPDIIVFNAQGKKIAETFLGSALSNTGVSVAVADIDSDGTDEIVASPMTYQTNPIITTLEFDETTSSLSAVSSAVDVASSNALISPIVVDGNIGYITNGHQVPKIIFMNVGGTETQTIAPYASDSTDALVASPIIDDAKTTGIVVANAAPHMNDDVSAKSIHVDKSQQRLTSYEYGVPVYTFLVSTAKKGFYTPVGKTAVRAKLLYHDYKWIWGIGDPNNYNVPNVKWNLQIYDHIYIHWAYWHNNFGHPMSHGCINMNAENSEWIYNWTDVGTPVNVVE
ncbi:MAG: L,D-transpeptidase family protein [Patescibacteria group bacterium]